MFLVHKSPPPSFAETDWERCKVLLQQSCCYHCSQPVQDAPHFCGTCFFFLQQIKAKVGVCPSLGYDLYRYTLGYFVLIALQMLHFVSAIVANARMLGEEVRHTDIFHDTTIDGCR